jgi:hypothetical protein
MDYDYGQVRIKCWGPEPPVPRKISEEDRVTRTERNAAALIQAALRSIIAPNRSSRSAPEGSRTTESHDDAAERWHVRILRYHREKVQAEERCEERQPADKRLPVSNIQVSSSMFYGLTFRNSKAKSELNNDGFRLTRVWASGGYLGR